MPTDFVLGEGKKYIDLSCVARIMKSLDEAGFIGKTELSLRTRIQYTRLLKYLSWLAAKEMVEFAIRNRKIGIVLTPRGKTLAGMFEILTQKTTPLSR